MGGEYSMHGRDENEYKILSVRPKGKRPHGRCRHRLEDNIRMDLREVGWEGVDWTYLAQDRDHWWALVNKLMNLWVA
jgi:hypothetical protein